MKGVASLLILVLIIVVAILIFTDGPMPRFHPELSRPDVTYSPMPNLPKPVLPTQESE